MTRANSVQVHKPTYARSVRRWKRLEHRLRPAMQISAAAGLEY